MMDRVFIQKKKDKMNNIYSHLLMNYKIINCLRMVIFNQPPQVST